MVEVYSSWPPCGGRGCCGFESRATLTGPSFYFIFFLTHFYLFSLLYIFSLPSPFPLVLFLSFSYFPHSWRSNHSCVATKWQKTHSNTHAVYWHDATFRLQPGSPRHLTTATWLEPKCRVNPTFVSLDDYNMVGSGGLYRVSRELCQILGEVKEYVILSRKSSIHICIFRLT